VFTIRSRRFRRWITVVVALGNAVTVGCQSTPINLAEGPAPLRIPRPGQDAPSYEDSLTGGEVFAMYCNQCHNARALGERPFINYQNVAAHMRVRANLTGKEYEKLMEFLRRWNDIPSPTPPVEPSPKRLIFAQPIAEMRDELAPRENAGNPAAAPNNAAGPPQPGPAPAAAQPQPAVAQPQP
jgi:hypothetical protein